MNFYKTNYELMNGHNWSLTEMDSLMPWEKEVYISLLVTDLEEKAKNEQNG